MKTYIHLRKTDTGVKKTGMDSCSFGHRISGNASKAPDGIFAEWHWDGKVLRFENGRFGVYPVYFFQTANEICLSDSISTLLAQGASPELDHEALAVFMYLGFFLRDETPFKKIRSVPASCKLTWTEGHLNLDSVFTQPRSQHLNKAQAIDGYIELWRQSISRRVPEDDYFAVPLSGGRDSREILFELCRQGHRPRFCITTKPFPPRPFDDVEIASVVAKTLNIPHVVLDQPISQVQTELDKNILTSFCTEEHGWALVMAKFLAGKVSTIYDGIAGSILSNSPFQHSGQVKLMREGKFRAVAESLYSHPAAFRLFCDRSEIPKMQDLALTRIAEELERHAEAPNPLSTFYFWTRTRREIALAPCGMLDKTQKVYCPYLDHDFFDFLSSLEPELYQNHDFHDDAIRTAYPEYDHIPYDTNKTATSHNFTFFRRFAAETLLYAFTNRSQRLQYSYAVPRLMRCMVDPGYSSVIAEIAPFLLLLLQIEEASEGAKRHSRVDNLLMEKQNWSGNDKQISAAQN